jgi:hypothetical protein
VIWAALAALVTISASPSNCFELCDIRVRVGIQLEAPREVLVQVFCDGAAITSSFRSNPREGSEYFFFKNLPACEYTLRAAVLDTTHHAHTAITAVTVLGS